jgi:hypothetical protein
MVGEGGDLHTVEHGKPGSKPQNESVDEVPENAKKVHLVTKAKEFQEVVQSG